MESLNPHTLSVYTWWPAPGPLAGNHVEELPLEALSAGRTWERADAVANLRAYTIALFEQLQVSRALLAKVVTGGRYAGDAAESGLSELCAMYDEAREVVARGYSEDIGGHTEWEGMQALISIFEGRDGELAASKRSAAHASAALATYLDELGRMRVAPVVENKAGGGTGKVKAGGRVVGLELAKRRRGAVQALLALDHVERMLSRLFGHGHAGSFMGTCVVSGLPI